MLASAILSAALTLNSSAVSDSAATSEWNVHGIKKGKPVSELTTDVIAASAYADQGPGIIFFCSKSKGLFTVVAYEAEEDLIQQASETQNFLRKKSGSLTVNGQTIKDDWLWKRRHATLQAKETKTGIELLNAVFSARDAKLEFEDMDPMTLSFPKANAGLKDFIANCDSTRVRK